MHQEIYGIYSQLMSQQLALLNESQNTNKLLRLIGQMLLTNSNSNGHFGVPHFIENANIDTEFTYNTRVLRTRASNLGAHFNSKCDAVLRQSSTEECMKRVQMILGRLQNATNELSHQRMFGASCHGDIQFGKRANVFILCVNITIFKNEFDLKMSLKVGIRNDWNIRARPLKQWKSIRLIKIICSRNN